MSDIRIAVIGDIHSQFDDTDVRMFNESDYDLILIVGDLPGRTHAGTLEMASFLSRLRKPSYFMPGNHDGVSLVQLIAELKASESLVERSFHRQFKRCEQLKEALGPVEYCGYSLHNLDIQGRKLHLLSARPHSMGGPRLGYRPYLKAVFGVDSFADSADRLKSMFNQCTEPVLVLAHNGPAGLGANRHDIFGCDFKKEEGDFGDPDLQDAIAHAVAKGKHVLAVAAGHMHHRVRGGGERITDLSLGGIHYLNAARVPRIWKEDGRVCRHHARLVISQDWSVTCEQMKWVSR
jgi:uncharacterized protein (TIGR04168 family)